MGVSISKVGVPISKVGIAKGKVSIMGSLQQVRKAQEQNMVEVGSDQMGPV